MNSVGQEHPLISNGFEAFDYLTSSKAVAEAWGAHRWIENDPRCYVNVGGRGDKVVRKAFISYIVPRGLCDIYVDCAPAKIPAKRNANFHIRGPF